MILEYNILLIQYKYTMLGYSIARIRYTTPSQRANRRYYLKVSDIKRKVVPFVVIFIYKFIFVMFQVSYADCADGTVSPCPDSITLDIRNNPSY